MATVQLKNIKKVYPFISGEQKKKSKKNADEPEKKKVNLQITDEGVVAVQAFNLDIADKEFIVLVGPSGCGKSTTLRMVAGLEEITDGELYIDGKLKRLYPLGRIVEAREVAEAVAFLASARASGITGVVMPVDAGLTAGFLPFIDDILGG